MMREKDFFTAWTMSPRYVPVSIKMFVLKVLAYSRISSSLTMCGGGDGRPCFSHVRRASRSRRSLSTSSGRVFLITCFSEFNISRLDRIYKMFRDEHVNPVKIM